MERKFEIPTMSKEEIVKWYANINPIVRNRGIPMYLRDLSKEELTNISFTSLEEPTDYKAEVDFSELSVLADVKMFHTYGYYGFFKPSVDEVIMQIPREYMEKVVAFEIIKGGTEIASIFNEELNAGFHVSIVRLYQTKDDTNDVAQPVDEYPTNDSKLPIGMTEEEFQEVRELYGEEW